MAAIEAAAAAHPWSAQQLAQSVDAASNEACLLALRGSQIVGYVIYASVLDEASLLNVVVAPAHQRCGFARLLLRQLLAELVSRNTRRCLLEVRVSNHPARRLYASLGFEIDGVRKRYYPAAGGREDAVLMSRNLESPA